MSNFKTFDGLIDKMKQFHNQCLNLNIKRDEEIPSSQNPPYVFRTFKGHSKSAVKALAYLFKEHRFSFMLLDILIASIFFILKPPPLLCLPDSTVPGSIPGGIIAHGRISNLQKKTVRLPFGIGSRPVRVLVTGGAGFVGSHLVDKLTARGDEVIVIDNFFTGRKENLVHHFGNPRLELIRHFIIDPILLEVDQIYHLACPASPIHYKYNPIKTVRTNVMGTLNMLGDASTKELAAEHQGIAWEKKGRVGRKSLGEGRKIRQKGRGSVEKRKRKAIREREKLR